MRLPGSGGACDIACLAGRTVIDMSHEPRRFVERVDYGTSPGHAAGGAVPTTPVPTGEVLHLIRRFDPDGFWTG